VTREGLERNQIAIYFASVAVAATAGLLAPAATAGLDVLVTPAIAVLMYAMFLQIPFLSLRDALGERRFVGALLLANFVLIPLLVWVLTRHLADREALLIGALLVLLTPCIDYVVVFTHLGKGDAKLTLSATPILLLLQFALLPVYLSLMLDDNEVSSIPFAPFLDAFLFLIVGPLLLAVATEALTARSHAVRSWCDGWLWMPVPAMAAVLVVVIASQIDGIRQDATTLMAVLPVYAGFVVFAPIIGALAARTFRLSTPAARAVAFSSATRNSLVVLPLALALPPELRTLAAASVIAQTLVELIAELIYLKAIPALVR
jgi:Arsenite efflux pump ACR3 and related permeases